MTLLLALLLLVAPTRPDSTDQSEQQQILLQAVASYVEPFDAAFDATQVRTDWVDLNGDSRLDVLVYLEGASWCGSGGCTLLVMEAVAPEDVEELGAYRPAAEISLVHLPLTVASTASHGWRDLIVQTAEGATRRLSFDGETYPISPSAGVAVDAAQTGGTAAFMADAESR